MHCILYGVFVDLLVYAAPALVTLKVTKNWVAVTRTYTELSGAFSFCERGTPNPSICIYMSVYEYISQIPQYVVIRYQLSTVRCVLFLHACVLTSTGFPNAVQISVSWSSISCLSISQRGLTAGRHAISNAKNPNGKKVSNRNIDSIGNSKKISIQRNINMLFGCHQKSEMSAWPPKGSWKTKRKKQKVSAA